MTLPKPYFDELLIEIVERNSVLLGSEGNKFTIGKVVAKGWDVQHTEIDEYVAFELWDLKESPIPINDSKAFFVPEAKIICQLDVSLILAA